MPALLRSTIRLALHAKHCSSFVELLIWMCKSTQGNDEKDYNLNESYTNNQSMFLTNKIFLYKLASVRLNVIFRTISKNMKPFFPDEYKTFIEKKSATRNENKFVRRVYIFNL